MTNTQDRESRYRISRCVSSLISTHPFFAHLALNLNIREDSSVWTIASDGKSVFYNPDWVQKTPGDQIKCAIARLVLACGLKHHTRRGDRDYLKWQLASQLATLPILHKAGLTTKQLPVEMSAEKAYETLSETAVPSGNPDPNGEGEIKDSQEGGASLNDEEQRWDSMMHRARQNAREAGNSTAAVEEMVDSMHSSMLDWRTLLKRFMTDTAKSDYTWTTPNKRHIAAGLYLPSLHSESMPPFIFAIDTSGSMPTIELAAVWSEIRAAAQDLNPESLTVVQCDMQVHKMDIYNPHSLPLHLSVVGRGGTAFSPVFEAVAEMTPPACMIYFTDLGSFDYPKFPPPYPVIWAVSGEPDSMWNPPFGERVDIPPMVEMR